MLFAMLGDANDAAAAAALGVTTVASAACSACREEWVRSRAASCGAVICSSSCSLECK